MFSYGLYMKSRGGVGEGEGPKKPVVKSSRDALDILEEAIISQGVGTSSDMVRRPMDRRRGGRTRSMDMHHSAATAAATPV